MKNNNQNDENKNKDENASSFNKMKRSSKFDDLTGTSNIRPNSPNGSTLTTKEKVKKVWKWIVICIYLFLAGLGVTGFIQSCVLKTSSTVGSGIELYNNGDVAPYVTSYKINEDGYYEYKYDENGNPIVDKDGNFVKEWKKSYNISRLGKENYLAPDSTIHKIRENLKKDYGQEVANLYGKYGNYSTSLRVIGLGGDELKDGNSSLQGENDNNGLLLGDKVKTLRENQDTGIIFMNDFIIDYLNDNGLKYIAQNDWYDINYFVAKRPDNWNSLPNSAKDYYGTGITDLSSSFIPYEVINGKYIKVNTDYNGSYITNDVNGDGIIDSLDPVVIKDNKRISKFVYKLDAEVATLSKEETGLFNSEMYARDYIQSLANIVVKFVQLNNFYTLINQSADVNKLTTKDIFENYLSKAKLESLINNGPTLKINNNEIKASNGYFTLQQKNAILTYQQEMTNLMSKIGFGIRRQVYSDPANPDYVPNNTTPFSIEFLPNVNDKRNILIGTPSIEQKPITSWGDSWRLGPFYGLIVYPLSFMINGMMGPMPNMNGWAGIIAIIIAILVTRVIVTLFTYKSLFTTHKQQQLNPKKAKIDAKYEPFKGNREMEQRKRQELTKLYKANSISMVEPFKAMCISMPIFFAVWRVVQGIPDIKATTWLGIQFSLTSWKELFNGEWQYLPLLLLAASVQAISHLLPKILNKKRMKERANKAEQAALKKSNKTQNIVMIVFIVISVIFEAGVQVYWIVSGLWQIMQVLVVHHIVKSEWYRTKGYKYV